MRVPLIAGNWKMNTDISETVKLIKEMRPLLDEVSNVEKAVCPPFLSLPAAADALKGSTIKLGAQNMHFEDKGAYTGEVSPLMIKGFCEYVILGHSERRQYFGETNEMINKKINAALRTGIKPVLCVGEKLDQYESNKTESVVTDQVNGSLKDIDAPENLVIAYEPVWAIGTGMAANGIYANKVIALIREILAKIYGDDFAQDIRILYGGSVTGDNVAEFIGQPEIDGGLIGGASLKADQFAAIVAKTSELKYQ